MCGTETIYIRLPLYRYRSSPHPLFKSCLFLEFVATANTHTYTHTHVTHSDTCIQLTQFPDGKKGEEPQGAKVSENSMV